MHYRWHFFLTVGLLLGMSSGAFSDNLLQNANFREGMQGWHGDGKAVFLRTDGTEGVEADPGVIQVLKIKLTKKPHSVYQEIHSREAIGHLQFSVEVYASTDFMKSSHTEDYGLDQDVTLPVVDFNVRFYPDFTTTTSDLKPGEWTKVSGTFAGLVASENRSLFFIVPPGTGYVYLKNVTLEQ